MKMMKLELKPYFEDGEQNNIFNARHAGCSKDGRLSWVYSDSLIEVYLADSDEIVATWRFGKILHDTHTRISCVTDVKYHGAHMLLVATSNLSDQGTLCMFSLAKKRVVRAVEFPSRITALEVLFSNTDEDVPSWVISHHLNFFCGLVAVGTKGGYVYLTDLCLDELMTNFTTEAEPKKLSVTSGNIVEPKAKRDHARSHNKHMALLLDDQCHSHGEFYYRRQDDSVQKVFNEDDVHVTCLKNLSQAGILTIGFNFGCFQMWRLSSPALDYSSRYKADSPAVSHFILHEPENDPRKLLYLWIANDDSIQEEDEDRHNSVAIISMYQLCFGKKDFYPNFGLFYEDLESVYFWMDHKLSLDPYSSDTRGIWSSKLVNAYTICNPLYTPSPVQANDSFEEGLHSHDQSLSLFVWKVDSKQGSGSSTSHYWMAIFDLNRWYHAQMPHSIRCVGTVPQVCPYWAAYRLDDVAASSSPPIILDVQVTGNNVSRFASSSSLPPLEHCYPSALEINDVRFITCQKIITGHCYGWQGQLLQDLAQDGANYLVQPPDFYHQCLRARLVPQHCDSETSLSTERKRHALLNLSLDYGLTPSLVHRCVELWADGEYVQLGCSFKFLLDWAWNCVVKIKEKFDTTCESLFDMSGQPISSHTLWTIQRQHNSLCCLNQIFTAFLSLTSPVTDSGELELELRQETIKLLLQHYEIVLWCISESLLPEMGEDGTKRNGVFVYPVAELMEAYMKRRQEMAKLEGVIDGYPLLLVDGLVSCEGEGNQISSMWENRSGNGLYPPPSMQAAVYLFLLEDICLEVKQAVMLYLLLDLAAFSDDHSETLVASFIQRFMIAPSLVHKVQGIWFLDHRDYEEGLRQLIRPNTSSQGWMSWIDTAVINTLLAQGEARTATCYVHSGHSIGESAEERRLMISVLVRNSKVSQAVEFIRRCSHGNEDSADLMPHLLKECHEQKVIGQLLQLNFKQHEEIHIEHYMRERTEPNSLEPLFLYYLHRARFVQAFELNEEMNRMDRMEASLSAQERSSNRNRLMNAYLKVLPDITRKLIMEKQKNAFLPVKRIRVTRPTPLSTVVHKQNHQAMSRSGFVMALMDKVDEAMQMVEDALEEAPDIFGEHIDKEDETDSRFLKTPLTPRGKSFTRTPSKVPHPSEVNEIRIPTNPLSAAKQRTQAGKEAEATEGYRSLHALTMECLSVLQTPSKDRGPYQSPKIQGLDSVQMKTPQSILKVRRISRTSLSKGSTGATSQLRLSPHTKPKKLGFSQSEPSLLSTPSPSASGKPPVKTPSATTPKQIRFAGLSPTPSPSPAVPSRELSRSMSEEESDEVWTDAMETSVDGESKGQTNVASHSITARTDDVENAGSPDVADCEAMDVTPVTPESSAIPVTETESPDRYDEAIGDLVRPDLLSPWKNDASSENGDDEVADDEEITFNLSRHRKESTTASPVAEHQKPTETRDTDGCTEQVVRDEQRAELNTKAITGTSALEKFKATNHTSLHSSLTKSTSPKVGTSQSRTEELIASTTMKYSKSIKETTVHYESQSLSQTLSIDTSGLASVSQTVFTPEKRRREPDSPPATPPSSKMIKLRHLSAWTDQEHQPSVSNIYPSTVFGKEAETQKTVGGGEKSALSEKSSSPQQSTMVVKTATVSSIQVTNPLEVASDGAADTKEIMEGEFVSSEEFFHQLEIERKASPSPEPEHEMPPSPSRRKSSRLIPSGSTNESSSDDLPKRSVTSRQSIAVLREMASLVETDKPKSRLGRRTRGADEKAADSDTADNLLSVPSLRRSLRSSKTPERVLPSTSTRRQSKTPERRLGKVKEVEKETVQQNMELDESTSHNLRTRRRSKTPERVVKTNLKDTEGTSTREADTTENDLKSEEDNEVGRNLKNPQQPAKESEAANNPSASTLAVLREMASLVETDKPRPRPGRRTRGADEKAIDSTEGKLDAKDESMTHNLRRTRRQSKTPERVVKRIVLDNESESGKEVKKVEEVHISTRQSTRQSKTPERFVKGGVHESSASEKDEGDISGHNLRRSRRQSKTPERKPKPGSSKEIPSESEDAAEMSSLGPRSSTRATKTPERVLKKQPLAEDLEKNDVSESTLHELRQSRRQRKTPERKRPIASEDTSSEKEEVGESSSLSVRRSHRQLRTPERLISSIEGISRKSNRLLKSPDRLSTPEIQSLPSTSPTRTHNQLKNDPPSTPPTTQTPPAQTSPAQTPPAQTSPAQMSQTLSPTSPGRKILIAKRRLTPSPLKSPERLDNPVAKSVSPNKLTTLENESAQKTGQESTNEEPTKKKSKAQNIDETQSGGDWSDEMPPLRLDVDEEEDREEMNGAPTQLRSKDLAAKVVEIPTPQSFVFSAPVHYSPQRKDSNQQKTKESSDKNASFSFMFSNPTSATPEPPSAIEAEEVVGGTSDGGASSESSTTQDKKRVTRKKKKLYNEYSPKLLPPLTEHEKERSERAMTRRESMRASMSMRRQSQGAKPVTRRVRPSSTSSK